LSGVSSWNSTVIPLTNGIVGSTVTPSLSINRTGCQVLASSESPSRRNRIDQPLRLGWLKFFAAQRNESRITPSSVAPRSDASRPPSGEAWAGDLIDGTWIRASRFPAAAMSTCRDRGCTQRFAWRVRRSAAAAHSPAAAGRPVRHCGNESCSARRLRPAYSKRRRSCGSGNPLLTAVLSKHARWLASNPNVGPRRCVRLGRVYQARA
jgi:hypothetical protein